MNDLIGDIAFFIMLILFLGIGVLVYNEQISFYTGFYSLVGVVVSYIATLLALPNLLKLMAPSHSIKTVMFLDKETFESYIPKFNPDSVAVIAIRDSQFSELHKIDRKKFRVLDLDFLDDYVSFSPEHVKKIELFLLRKSNRNIDTIVVSCQFGISRSPAIALGLSFCLQTNIFPYPETYNTHVLKVFQENFSL